MKKKKDILNLYCKDIMNYQLLSKEEEKRLFTQYIKTKSSELKERLILANLRFVIMEAKRFVRKGVPLMDLIAEGTIGLIRAIEKFNPKHQVHFISYAVWWIRQAILEYLYKNHFMIRLPVNLLKEILKKEKGIKSEKSSFLHQRFMNIIHMEDKLQNTEENKDEYGDYVPAGKEYEPERFVENYSLQNCVKNLLNTLSEKEKHVLEMRFGLSGYNKMSLKEISKRFKLTKERIRQIQNKALYKLKRFYEKKYLKDFLKDF